MKSDQRIFFDISALLNHIKNTNHYTGIQRVVSMIISEMSIIHDTSSLFLSYIDQNDGKQKCICVSDIGLNTIRSSALMQAMFFQQGQIDTTKKILKKYSKNPLKLKYYKFRLDVMAALGHDRSFRRFGIDSSDWKRIRKQPNLSQKIESLNVSPLRSKMRKGDALVLLDSTWDAKYFDTFSQAKKLGCHVYTLVHDLIPIRTPEMTPGVLPVVFEKWISSSPDFTNTYLTVSHATKKDLESYLSERGLSFDIHVLSLAQDRFLDQDPSSNTALLNTPDAMGAQSDPDAMLRANLKTIVQLPHETREALSSPYALCVGTREPRKNIWRLVLAWKHLVDTGAHDLPRLVIAGKESVMIDAVKNVLEATGNIYGYVSVLDSPTEEELACLYENCQFLVMPSLFEGWGLPVGEALSYGKTAVVSNTSSLPEVGGNFVEYCDPSSISSIADAVQNLTDLERRKSLEERIRNGSLRTWHDVAISLQKITSDTS